MRLLIFYFFALHGVAWLETGPRRFEHLDVVQVQTARRHWIDDIQTAELGGFRFLPIPKAMSTMTRHVFCDLLLNQYGAYEKPSVVGEGNICLQNHWFPGHARRKRLWKPLADPPTVLIFRDPVQRFVSMYRYLCKEEKNCAPKADIHNFAKGVYLSLRNNKMVPGFGDDVEVFQHIQPSFWFAYNVSNHLPSNPSIVYQSLNRSANADQLQRALVKGNVPPKIAAEVVEILRGSFGNTKLTVAGQRDSTYFRQLENKLYEKRETVLYVLAAYYNDYRLLKIALPEELLEATRRHGIALPDPIQAVNGQKILLDGCDDVRKHRTDDGRQIPLSPC